MDNLHNLDELDQPAHRTIELARTLVEAIQDNRLDEAERLLEELTDLEPDTKEHLVFPVLISIQRGYVKEALLYINGLEPDACPELKAVCMNILGDPLWHAQAESCLDSPDPHVRKAMRQMLMMEPEEALS